MTRSRRLFLIWMYAPDYPGWSMPAQSIQAIQQALGESWTVRSLEVPAHASGDGATVVPEELLDLIADAEVFCGWGIPREAFLAARQLRWVHSGAAGVGASLFPELLQSDVVLTNSAGTYAESMAEHALAMMFFFARGLDVATRGQDGGRWTHARLAGEGGPVTELSGLTLGIVGYGGIGQGLARRAKALGMSVRAIRRTRGGLPPELDSLAGPEGLSDLLSSSDFIVLTIPETPETRQLIGRQELAMVHPGAVLINVARGGVVDEHALIQALTERRLRGAGLDVFAQEPLPQDSPLWKMENVLVTPHVGGVSPKFWDRETDLIVRNIRRYLGGKGLENVVRKELGY